MKACETCQKTKSGTSLPAGKMKTPKFPYQPLTDIAVDFVGPLPLIGGYDMLLTCTCQLSGFTRLIPCNQKDTAEKTASRFFSALIGVFGSPTLIIGDRDKTWTSQFWKALMQHSNTGFHMSAAYHPQADGRSGRTNKTVGQVLRTFTRKRQTKWLESLPSIELAINFALNVATGMSPFKLVFNRNQAMFLSNEGIINDPPKLLTWLRQREEVWTQARDALWGSRVHQAVHHNRRHMDVQVSEDSWVLLDSGDWRGRHSGGVDKLKEKSEGPYRVV